MRSGPAWVVLAVLLAGCVTEPGPREAIVLEPVFPPLPPARVAPLRAAAGVFYFAEFARGTLSDRSVPGVSHRPGPASVALFDHVLAAEFERVVRLAAWPPAATEARDLAVIFVPRLVAVATIREPSSAAAAGSSARLIEYRVELYTPAGALLDSWALHAKSRAQGPWTPRDDALYAGAFRDAAAQLLASIEQRPALAPKLRGADAAAAASGIPAAVRPTVSRGPTRLAIASVLESAEMNDRGPGGDAACLAGALSRAVPGMSLVPLERIRDAVFPWFEPSTLVDAARRMPELMREPAVRRGFQSAGVDYLALVHSERTSNRDPDALRCDTSYRAPGCSGVRGDALKTRLGVTLWNLERFTMSARFEAESARSATIAGLTVPIPAGEKSAASACERAAAAIRELIAAR